ncbi:MAG: hypothetical protein AB1611_21765 [bacterium]
MKRIFKGQRQWRQLSGIIVNKGLWFFSGSRMFVGLLIGGLLVTGFSLKASATEYYGSGYGQLAVFSSRVSPNNPNPVFRGGLDCASYGDLIYVRHAIDKIDEYKISVNTDDPSSRTLTHQRTITLSGNNEAVNPIGDAEIYVDARGIFITGGGDPAFIGTGLEFGGDVLHFNSQGIYIDNAVNNSDPTIGLIALLTYDPQNDIWYGADKQRRVYSYSSTGTGWNLEFEWSIIGAGAQGDGMEFVRDPDDGTGFLYVHDSASDYISQWAQGDNPETITTEGPEQWTEWRRFGYVGSDDSNVEGMGFGAFGHFWATASTSGSDTYNPNECCLLELGGYEIDNYTTSTPPPTPGPVPETSTISLLGLGLASLVITRKKLFQ